MIYHTQPPTVAHGGSQPDAARGKANFFFPKRTVKRKQSAAEGKPHTLLAGFLFLFVCSLSIRRFHFLLPASCSFMPGHFALGRGTVERFSSLRTVCCARQSGCHLGLWRLSILAALVMFAHDHLRLTHLLFCSLAGNSAALNFFHHQIRTTKEGRRTSDGVRSHPTRVGRIIYDRMRHA